MHTPDTHSGWRSLAPLLCTVALLLACGCATDRPPQWQNTAVLDVPYNRVFNDIVEFTRSFAPDTYVDALHGIVRTPDLRANLEEFPFDHFSREPGVFHEWSTRRFNTRYEVRRVSEEKTEVSIAAHYSAFSTADNCWLVWPSNGKYEEFLLSELRDRLQRGSHAAAQ
jgi:hypothetical protein